MLHDETAMSEVTAEILIISLIIALALVIYVMVMGVVVPVQKTAYIVTRATAIDIGDVSVVEMYHYQGDTVSLAPETAFGLPIEFTMTNGSVLYTATPLPSVLSESWKPGDNLYLVRNNSGLLVAGSPASVQGNIGFFPGEWTIKVIDKKSQVIVAQHTVVLKGNTSSPPVSYTRYPGFTTEAWVRWNIPPDPGEESTRKWATIVVDGTTDNNRRYHLQHNSDNSKFEFALATTIMGGSGTWVVSATTPADKTWYHVTGVYNKTPGTMAIFINGVSEGSKTVDSSGLRASPARYQVGGPSGINWPNPPPATQQRKFNGQIRGLKTYEEALSRAEILAHYSAGVP